MGLHRRTHPQPVEGCFGCKALNVHVSPAATPTRTAVAAAVERRMEAAWAKDMPAYKRLRDSGLQPKAIDGSAEIEQRAETRFEVESGHLYEHDQAGLRDAVDYFEQESAHGVFEPAATPKPEDAA